MGRAGGVKADCEAAHAASDSEPTGAHFEEEEEEEEEEEVAPPPPPLPPPPSLAAPAAPAADAKPKPVRKALGKLDANAKGGCASVEVTLHKESDANKGGYF